MVDPNTRTGKRTPVTLKIKFKSETLEQFIERYAVDVSQGGIFIRTKEPLAVGTQMRFEFQLRDASPLIGGEGTVVWTRENDPSRPAIAPGMGVRFDRLAEGSQSVLERILAEKAKQAPQRSADQATKPPLFTDTPTRVAPAPVQEQLLGNDKSRRRGEDSYNDQHTPLPKPMPFHSDADEFPDEAFEEATKVRALDELVAQTADPHSGGGHTGGLVGHPGPSQPTADELAARRRNDADQARAFTDLESAPGLPSPPEPGPPMKAPGGRLLDTTPSPRTESAPPMTPMAPMPSIDRQGERPASQTGPQKTRLGVEAPRIPPMPTPMSHLAPPMPGAPGPGPTMGGPMRAVAAEATSPVRMTAPTKKGSGAAIAILILVLLAAGAAGVWFFFLRDKAAENAATTAGSGSQGSQGSGSDGSAGSGTGSSGITTGSGSGSAAETPKGPIVETVIEASVPKANVEIIGTDQTGPAPFTAKLEKDKPYKARVMAPGFATLELDVAGGAPKLVATMVAKPKVLVVTTEPPGALISIDNVTSGKVTPFDVELTKAQAAKKSVRVRLYKNGYRLIEKTVLLDGLIEDEGRMIAKLDEKLGVQIQIKQPPPPDRGSAAVVGSGSDGSAAVPAGSGSGSAVTPPTPTPPAGSGSAAEPEPAFEKPPTP